MTRPIQARSFAGTHRAGGRSCKAIGSTAVVPADNLSLAPPARGAAGRTRTTDAARRHSDLARAADAGRRARRHLRLAVPADHAPDAGRGRRPDRAQEPGAARDRRARPPSASTSAGSRRSRSTSPTSSTTTSSGAFRRTASPCSPRRTACAPIGCRTGSARTSRSPIASISSRCCARSPSRTRRSCSRCHRTAVRMVEICADLPPAPVKVGRPAEGRRQRGAPSVRPRPLAERPHPGLRGPEGPAQAVRPTGRRRRCAPFLAGRETPLLLAAVEPLGWDLPVGQFLPSSGPEPACLASPSSSSEGELAQASRPAARRALRPRAGRSPRDVRPARRAGPRHHRHRGCGARGDHGRDRHAPGRHGRGGAGHRRRGRRPGHLPRHRRRRQLRRDRRDRLPRAADRRPGA